MTNTLPDGIAEIIVYTNGLSSNQMAAIHSYLTKKYMMESMPWWKVGLITLAICIPAIVLIEIISRLQKYRARITKELFELDKRSKECPDADVEQLWADVCWFEVETYKTHFQKLKILTIMSYIQARRAHIKRDTAARKIAGGQAPGTNPSGQPANRGEADPHGTNAGPSDSHS